MCNRETRAKLVAGRTQTVIAGTPRLLSGNVDSWQNSVNRNIDGHTVRRVLDDNGNDKKCRIKMP